MYPKVKVRALEDDDDYDCSINPLQGFDSLSIRDSTPPVKGVKHSSSVSVAKIPKSYVQRSIIPPPSLPKPAKNNEQEADAKKPRIRASSIPRPRAVISSPDNDQIMGSKNKMRLQGPSAMKKQDSVKNKQTEGPCIRASATSKNLFKRGEHKVTNAGTCTRTSNTKLFNSGERKVTNTSDVKAHKGSGINVGVPTTNISKAKPCFMIA